MTTIFDLTPIDIYNGTFQLFFVIYSFFIGGVIIKKYFKMLKEGKKRIELISLGLQWILISSAWWGSAFSFLSILIFQYAFQETEFVLMQNLFMNFGCVAWVHAFTHVFFKSVNRKRIALVLVSTIIIIGEIIMIVLFFVDRPLIGTQGGYFKTNLGIYLILYSAVSLFISMIVGFAFTYLSIRSDDKQIQKRGYFLLVSFLCFLISNVGIMFFNDDIIILSIMRIILVSGGLAYYVAFFYKFKAK